MGNHVYHSQLSCLTPVNAELKTITHTANMRTRGDGSAGKPEQQQPSSLKSKEEHVR